MSSSPEVKCDGPLDLSHKKLNHVRARICLGCQNGSKAQRSLDRFKTLNVVNRAQL